MPRSRGPRSARWGALLLASLALAGCGATTHAAAANDEAVQIAAVGQRLRGEWRLVRFDAATPLEPTLPAMLGFLVPRLAVPLQGGRLVATGPGITMDRRYEIRAPVESNFELVSYDESGVPYQSQCELRPDGALYMDSRTDPWRGIAVLQKIGP